MSAHEFLWFDLETTGLNPQEDCILEMGGALVNDGPGGDFEVVDTFDTVIQPSYMPALANMDPFVVNMHTKLGLLAAVNAGEGVSLADAEQFLCDLIPEGSKVVLAGHSVHFDLGFVRVHMPKFAARCSHRVFDVSTLKHAEFAWGDSGHLLTPAGGPAHRALADVLESISSARAFKARRY